MIFQELVYNAALLVLLGFFHSLISRKLTNRGALAQSLNGVLFGAVAVGVMAAPLHLMPGVVFDTRSVVLGIAGLFGGPLTAAVAVAMSVAARMWDGGAGALTGSLVAVVSGGIGVLVRYTAARRISFKAFHYYLFGLVVHAFMLLCMFTLPRELAWTVLSRISVPLMVIYPLITMVLCLLMADREERYRIEKELADNERRYRELVDQLPVAVAEYDLDLKLTFHNQQALRTFGYGAEEAEKLDITSVVPLEEVESFRSRLALLMRGAAPGQHELNLRHKDGHLIHGIHNPVPLVKDGQVTGVRTVFMDISERKRAEDRLRESRERFKQLFDNISDGVVLYRAVDDGADFEFVDINQAGAKLSGVDRDQVVDRRLSEMFPAADDMGLMRMLGHVWRTGQVGDLPLALYADDRIQQWVENHAFKLPSGLLGVIFQDTSQQRRADEARRNSEQRYRQLFEESPISLWEQDFSQVKQRMDEMGLLGEADLEGYLAKHPEVVSELARLVKVVDVNQASLRLYEADSKEQLKEGISGVHMVDSSSHQGFTRALAQIATGGSGYDMERTHHTLHGRAVPVHLYWSVASGYEKDYSRVLVSVVDLSQRQSALDALAQSEREKSVILDSTAELFVYFDLDLTIHWANRAAAASLGMSPEDLVGQCCYELWHNREEPCVGCPVIRARDTGQAQENETVTPDGRVWQARGYPIKDEMGNVVALTELTQDVTYKKQAEEALREQKELFETVLNKAPVMAALFGMDGRHTWVNRRWEETVGWTLEEASQQDMLATLFPAPATRDKVLKSVQQAEGSWTEADTTTRDGRVLSTQWATIRLADGTNVALGRDVTQQKKAIRERRSLEAQLLQSQKLESVGRLAGGVAHDFNNMLGVILGYADLLLEELSQDEPHREALEQIQGAGLRARDVARQLLAFGRKQVLQKRPLDMNELVAGFEKMLARLIGEDIKVEAKLARDLGPVNADPAMMEQILLNLAINARDAMPNGGTLTIETGQATLDEEYASTKPGVVPGEYVMLTVSDTGHGMDQATQAKIFEPFFTTKAVGAGTGLGLSTVYGIVKQHGGNIWVYSEQGAGTTFKVFLPLAPSATAREKRGAAPGSHAGRGETVLVVEDDPALRNLACRALARQGYQVLESRSPNDAQVMAGDQQGKIDMMLTDVVMPLMNGKELYDSLKDLRPEMKVLFMSGYTEDVIAHRGVLDEGVDFIQKPFSIKDLGLKVREVLDRE